MARGFGCLKQSAFNKSANGFFTLAKQERRFCYRVKQLQKLSICNQVVWVKSARLNFTGVGWFNFCGGQHIYSFSAGFPLPHVSASHKAKNQCWQGFRRKRERLIDG
jgi:hypothetical protein